MSKKRKIQELEKPENVQEDVEDDEKEKVLVKMLKLEEEHKVLWQVLERFVIHNKYLSI